METHCSVLTARTLAAEAVSPVDVQTLPLAQCAGGVLAREVAAAEDVPAFDRSPYDGYAFRAADAQRAGRETPVTLRVLEEVPAGAVPRQAVTGGTAVKVLTGAPIPPGADAVVKFEDTRFTPDSVTLFRPVRPGANIVRTGEDMRRGTVLARKGQVLDGPLLGVLAAQGVAEPLVYRQARVGLVSTGSELVEPDRSPGPGKIRNTNRYTLTGALTALGCQPVWLGSAGDDAAAIAALLEKGLETCDALVITGGVSVGDYDLTPAAMERVGAELLFRGVDCKPGMACAYAVKNGKLLCGLSGNPASSLTNFYAVAVPALKKLRGQADFWPVTFPVILKNGFPKPSPAPRFLRGRLELSGGRAEMELSQDQGNVVLSSAVGCDVMAQVPAGSGPVPAGTELRGFLL